MGIAGVAVAAVTSDSAKGNGSLDNGNGTFDNFSVYAKSGSAGEKPSGSVFVDFVAISRQTGATLGKEPFAATSAAAVCSSTETERRCSASCANR